MELTWYGYCCFRLTERNMASVVSDPYDARAIGFDSLKKKLEADIVTISYPEPGHNCLSAVKNGAYELTGPGEYELGGVFITAVQTNGFGKNQVEEARNTLYLIDYNGVTVAHLGVLNRVPSQTEVEALGPVNIALVPVGGNGALNSAKAAEVISLLEPNIVIPMRYSQPGLAIKLDPLSKFLKEMGLSSAETRTSLKIARKSDLPDETQVIVLDCQNA